MRIRVMVLSLLCIPGLALGDDFKIIKLEQDVRTLERQVGELSRQLAALQRRGPPSDASAAIREQRAAQPADNPLWYSRQNWDRVQPGMAELDVIRLLGKPTTVRGAGGNSTLFYAVEIGTAAFLSGSVDLRERRVISVSQPVLK